MPPCLVYDYFISIRQSGFAFRKASRLCLFIEQFFIYTSLSIVIPLSGDRSSNGLSSKFSLCSQFSSEKGDKSVIVLCAKNSSPNFVKSAKGDRSVILFPLRYSVFRLYSPFNGVRSEISVLLNSI